MTDPQASKQTPPPAAPRSALEALLERTRAAPLMERFPVEVAGRMLGPEAVVRHLRPYVTARRRQRIDRVVAGRTYAVAPVVEGLANVGNVSAVLRTAEALGCQAVHVVETGGRYKQSERTSRGAEKWLDLWRWSAPGACARHLKARGYRLVAMHLDAEAVPIDTIDFTQRTALVFGNERDGVSEAMRAACDLACVVPIGGFTESFNVSVAAAVALYHARQDRLARQGRHGDLSKAEQAALRADFYLRSVGRAEAILRRKLHDS